MSRTVVVVEDDVLLADSYRRNLARAGFQVHVVSSAIEAIEAIDDVKPDAIVLDLLLTGVTAFALLHELQSHVDLATVPVVLVTSAADTISHADVTAYGVRQVIDKSTMQPNDIVDAVRKVA